MLNFFIVALAFYLEAVFPLGAYAIDRVKNDEIYEVTDDVFAPGNNVIMECKYSNFDELEESIVRIYTSSNIVGKPLNDSGIKLFIRNKNGSVEIKHTLRRKQSFECVYPDNHRVKLKVLEKIKPNNDGNPIFYISLWIDKKMIENNVEFTGVNGTHPNNMYIIVNGLLEKCFKDSKPRYDNSTYPTKYSCVDHEISYYPVDVKEYQLK